MNGSFFVPSSCNETSPFLCLSIEATRRGFSCFDLSQIGDGRINRAGGTDERNTLRHCSRSSMLGNEFLCRSTNSCIPYSVHCSMGHRCPNRSDDQFWCDREHRPENCSALNDFVCFNGKCLIGARCNRDFECPFGEDEGMCDYSTSSNRSVLRSRQWKRFSRRSSVSSADLLVSSRNAEIDERHSNRMTKILSTSSFSPYWCNRGLGVLSTLNHSRIICFCPPQYFGEKCQFHEDRLSVVLRLDLSRSISPNETDGTVLLQLLVLFLFDDKVFNRDRFALHPSEAMNKRTNKLISHFSLSSFVDISSRTTRKILQSIFSSHWTWFFRSNWALSNTNQFSNIDHCSVEISHSLRSSSRFSSR